MRQVITGIVVSLAIMVMVAPAPANAGPYAGGSIGQTSADIGLSDIDDGSTLTGSVDDTDTRYKIYGGFRVLKFFAVEAAWADLGTVSATATSDGAGLIYAPGDVSSVSEADGYSVSALGVVPIGTKFRLFAKAGFMFWDATTTISNAGIPGGALSVSDDGSDPIFGAGMVWDYTGPGQVRVELEQAEIDGMDVTSVSAGLSFMF